MSKCRNCNKEIVKQNSKYHEYIFCSKSCSALSQRGSLNREILVGEVVDYVLTVGRYCTGQEIREAVGRSSKTFSKYGISITEIQKEIGFEKSGSVFETKVRAHLTTLFDDLVLEHSPPGLLSPKGYPLRVDFFIPTKSFYIEADGSQHLDTGNPWYSEYARVCDELKASFCKSAGIFIRIPYNRKCTLEHVLKYLPPESLINHCETKVKAKV